MEPSKRYLVGTVTGVALGATTYIVARPVLGVGQAWFAAGLTAVVWAASVVVYVPVYDQFDGPPGDVDDLDTSTAAVWGGVSGGSASLAVVGTVTLVLLRFDSVRYPAAVGLFVLGAVLLSMAVGMRVVALNCSGTADPVAAGDTADDG